MALYRSDAFVLRTYKLGEADQIVVFLTENYGKVRAVARRSRSAKRQTASYYQPMTWLHAIFFGRSSQNLHRINSVDIIEPFRTLREDFTLMRCGLYMTELLDAATRDREPVTELFTLFRQGLGQLTETPTPDTLLRLFELQLLMLIGYTPQLFACVRCARDLAEYETAFSPAIGGLICRSCMTDKQQITTVCTEALDYLRQGVMSGAEAVPPLPDDADVCREIETVLHQHLTARLGRELKSYAFLHL
ncbi:DNA repair protein RecO [Candidatus Entotheonella serta]|nr:DNA repair protein RecO [Candidatus Entotheonella serta]